MKAREDCLPWSELEQKLKSLQMALDVNDVGVVLAMLQQLVSGYQPSGEIVDWVHLEQEADIALR
jgi:hypothetical protein